MSLRAHRSRFNTSTKKKEKEQKLQKDKLIYLKIEGVRIKRYLMNLINKPALFRL